MESRLLSTWDEIEALAGAWDALPDSRADHADIFDSFAWLSAWERSRQDRRTRPLRVITAVDGEALAGALPIVNPSRNEAGEAGFGFRPRFRPVLHGGFDSERVSDVLVEGLRRAEVRDLHLVAVSEHDPSFRALRLALARGGYRVSDWPGAPEYLSPCDGPWDEFRSRFRQVDEQSRRRAKKLVQLGPTSVDCIRPAADGFPTYLEIHLRSWKGALAEPWRTFRGHFLEGCRERDWARLFVLRLGDLPIAVHLWFVVGRNAIWYSGAYDDRFAAMSPGSILMWESIRRVHDLGAIATIDFLPGGTPQKERLAPVRPRLHTLHISRSRLSIAIREAGLRARTAYRRLRGPGAAPDPEGANDAPKARDLVGFRSVDAAASRGTARPLEPDGKVESFLAVSGGHPSLQAMKADWGPEDRWWTVSNESEVVVALVRTRGAGGALLGIETILLAPGGLALTDALAAVSRALGTPVRFAELLDDGEPGSPMMVREGPIPWTFA